MVEEQSPAPFSFKDVHVLIAQSVTPETQQAAFIAALGGAQSKRAREYLSLLDTLNSRLARK